MILLKNSLIQLGTNLKNLINLRLQILWIVFPILDMGMLKASKTICWKLSRLIPNWGKWYPYDGFFVHQVLASLQINYKQLKFSYTSLRDKWSIDELISVYLQGKDRMNHKRAERAHLTIVLPNKKGNNHYMMFNFQKRNHQGNSQSPSWSCSS